MSTPIARAPEQRGHDLGQRAARETAASRPSPRTTATQPLAAGIHPYRPHRLASRRAAARVHAAYPVALSTVIRTTTRTAPGRSSPGSLPSYFQDSSVSNRRPTSGVIDTRPRSST